jgi:hypothetical protein
MECLPVEKIPEGDLWTYELKRDGYRAIAVNRRREGDDLLTLRFISDAALQICNRCPGEPA